MEYRKGFTLIEIIVAVAILAIVISFASFVDLNSFTGDNFLNERARIVSVLERARSRAMANLLDSNYGVCYIAPNYSIFEGNTCVSDETIPANTNIASNASSSFPTIVFNRLTGDTSGGTIHITDGTKQADITINHEGTINW